MSLVKTYSTTENKEWKWRWWRHTESRTRESMGRESWKLGEHRLEGTYHTGVHQLSRVSFWMVNSVSHSHITLPPANSTPSKKGTLRWQGLYNGHPGMSYSVPVNRKNRILLAFRRRIVKQYTTFLEPASYMSRASPPSLKHQSSSSQAKLKACRVLPPWKTHRENTWIFLPMLPRDKEGAVSHSW